MSWSQASAYCNQMGMRLPEAEEYSALLRPGQFVDLRDHLDGCVFARTQIGTFWSSTQSRVGGLADLDLPHDRVGSHVMFWIARDGDVVTLKDAEDAQPSFARCVKGVPP